MSAIHLATSWVLLVATALHVAGAIKHALVSDGVFSRMTWRRASGASPAAARTQGLPTQPGRAKLARSR